MRPLGISVASLIIVAFSIGNAEARYEKLNVYLTAKVPGNAEVAPNMEAASRWLQQQESVETSSQSSALVDELKEFAALKEIVDDTKCDGTAYGIMRANENAVRLHRLKVFNEVLRRVDKVVLKILKDHAEKCLSVYSSNYHAKKAQLDELVLKHVEGLAKTVMSLDNFPASNEPRTLFDKYIKYQLGVRDFARNDVLLKALIHNSLGKLDASHPWKDAESLVGKQVVDKRKLNELVTKYLIEPCKQFETVMGPDLFFPAEFEAQLYYKIGDDEDYFKGWASFKICQAITSDDSAVFKTVAAAQDRYQ